MTVGLPRTGDTGRLARLTSLACALGLLLTVFAVCTGPVTTRGHGSVRGASASSRTGPSPHLAPVPGHPQSAAARTQPGSGTARTQPAQHGTRHGPVAPYRAWTVHVCSALDEGGGHSGCDSSSDRWADATLPGPPPQPAPPAAVPYLPLPPAPASEGPRGPLPGSDLAPDLHLLQVQRN